MKKIILVDLSTYPVYLPKYYKNILSLRLKYEEIIAAKNIGFNYYRGKINYSRGLLMVAASLLEKGHKVTYLIYFDQLDRKGFDLLLKEADVVGITAVTPTINLAANISKYSKSVNPNLLTIVGGPHSNAIPVETLMEFPTFDFIVSGPGESVLPELISNIGNHKLVKGIVFRNDSGTIIHSNWNKPTVCSAEIKPAYDLLSRSIDMYAHNIRTQEGCPYNCKYCVDNYNWNGTISQRSIESIMHELTYLHKFCKSNTLIHFSDSIFNLDNDRAMLMCEYLRELSDKFIYSIDTRADLINSEFIKIASASGIKYFRFGAEDVQSKLLNSKDESISLNSITTASNIIRKSSTSSVIHLYWMTGLPGSTHDSLIKSTFIINKLIRNKSVDIVGNRIFVPYPGTEYSSAPMRYGVSITDNNWNHYDRLSMPVYKLNELSATEIYDSFIQSELTQLKAYENIIGSLPDTNIKISSYVNSSYIARKINDKVVS